MSRSDVKIRKGNQDADQIIACLKGDDSVGIRIKTIVARLQAAAKEADHG